MDSVEGDLSVQSEGQTANRPVLLFCCQDSEVGRFARINVHQAIATSSSVPIRFSLPTNVVQMQKNDD